ncbi:hypothetical protein, partial [Pseudoalteromonas sp. TAB23]|uniref:hypothetical protein n=1 Tax=Pseudoalteromonas sp. TAB23 TaxID=1938595 RepID=UPI00051972DF
TLSLANNALAIRIIFPLVGVIRHLSAYRVCQLCWANNKNLGRKRPSFKTSPADLSEFLSDLIQ